MVGFGRSIRVKGELACVIWLTAWLVSPFSPSCIAGETALPTAEQQKQMQAVLRDTYGEEFREADTPTRKAVLAKKLLGKAKQAMNEPVSYFVLLSVTRDIAALGGDVETAMQAHELQASTFRVNDTALRMQTFQKLAENTQSEPQHRALADAALKAVDTALSANRFDDAAACASLASKAASKAKAPELHALAKQRLSEIRQAEAIFQDWDRLRGVLKANPGDPDANLAGGMYHGLLKRDWRAAAPLLAKGSDATFRRIAAMELKQSRSGEDLLRLADLWASIGESSKGLLRRRSLERAAAMYRAAQSRTTGLLQDRAKERLADISRALRSSEVESQQNVARSERSRRSRKKTPLSWTADDIKTVRTFSAGSSVHDVAFSPDSSMVAAGTGNSDVYVWDVDSTSPRHKLQGHEETVRAVAFDPAEKILASGSHDGAIKLWDVKTGKQLTALGGHTRPVHVLAFSPDGSLLASASVDNTAKVWDVKTGRQVYVLAGHSRWVNGVDFAPNGRKIVTTSSDGTVVLWDVATGRSLGLAVKHSVALNRCDFSPNGELVATGTKDRLVLVVSGPNARPIPFAGHTDEVIGIDFAPDGTTIASTSRDATVRLWDMTGKQGPKTINGSGKQIYCVAFSPNGALLAAGGDDQTVTVWTPVRK